jgi:hypothetical protein
MIKNDARDIFPWVIIDPKTYEIIRQGNFESLVGETNCHLMPLSVYEQTLKEREDGTI